MAHAWAEYGLKNGELDLDGYVGAECPDAELAQFPPLTKEMAEAVNVYLGHVLTLLSPADELHVERGFSLEFVAPGMFGTNDCCILKPAEATLHVIDYKHGRGVVVDAEDNPQLKYYALGALHVFRDVPIKRVVMTIVQPRAGGEPIRSFELDALDIWEFALELAAGAKRAREENAPRCPGSHCQFCPGTKGGACAEFQNRALAVAHDGFGEILPPEKLPTLSADELGERLDQVYLLEMWCTGFKEFCKEQAFAGNMPRGYKFVTGRGVRKWNVPDEVVIDASRALDFDATHLGAMSPPQVEKHWGKKRLAQLAHYVTNSYSKPILVKESDRRKALSLEDLRAISADGFEAIED
jgi:hypothetical protein